jgi:hypothetical protein
VFRIDTASVNDLEGLKWRSFLEWDIPSLPSDREGITKENGRQEVAEIKEGSQIGKYNFLYLVQTSK